MNIRYAKLLEIRCRHLYYTDRECTDLRLIPTRSALRMLANYRMVLREVPGGVVVLAQVQGTPARLSFPIGSDEGFRLVFKLEMTNPWFLNFTELPYTAPSVPHLKPLKTGYYFSNLQNNPLHLTGPDEDLQLLSKKNASPASTDDRVVFWNTALRIRLNPPANNLEYKIKNTAGTEVFSDTINKADPFSEYAPQNPPPLRPGLYQLTVNGGAALPVYIDDTLYFAPPFGLVEIHHGAAVPDNYKIVQPGTTDVPVFQRYHLLFDARSTVWRYIFPAGLAGVAAVKKGGVTFTKVTAEKLFKAPAAIKMSDAYQPVQMTKNAVTKNIPNPAAASVKPDQVAGEVYADVYL